MQKLIILFLLILPLSFGCTNKQNQSTEGFKNKPVIILATVGGEKIKSDQFETMYNQATVGRQPGTVPGEGVLTNLVRLQLGALEAKKEHLDKDATIDFQIKAILTRALLQKHVGDALQALNVADEEAKEYYEKNPRRRASQILLKVPPDADQSSQVEIQKKANDIYQQAVADKKSFPEFAKKYSDDPTGKNGGDLNYFSKHSMTPEIAEAAFALKEIGDVSQPIKSPAGWHIIQLTGKRSFQEEDKKLLKEAMMEVKRNKVVNDYFASLEKQHEVHIYKDILERIDPKP